MFRHSLSFGFGVFYIRNLFFPTDFLFSIHLSVFQVTVFLTDFFVAIEYYIFYSIFFVTDFFFPTDSFFFFD